MKYICEHCGELKGKVNEDFQIGLFVDHRVHVYYQAVMNDKGEVDYEEFIDDDQVSLNDTYLYHLLMVKFDPETETAIASDCDMGKIAIVKDDNEETIASDATNNMLSQVRQRFGDEQSGS